MSQDGPNYRGGGSGGGGGGGGGEGRGGAGATGRGGGTVTSREQWSPNRGNEVRRARSMVYGGAGGERGGRMVVIMGGRSGKTIGPRNPAMPG